MTYNPSAGSGITGIGSAVGGASAGASLYNDASGNLQQDATLNKYNSALTYNPANFYSAAATKVYWLPLTNSAFVLDGSNNPCTNGVDIEKMVDTAGSLNFTFFGGTRYKYRTNVVNGLSVISNESAGNNDYSFSSASATNSASIISAGMVYLLSAAPSRFDLASVQTNSGASYRFLARVNSTPALALQGNSADSGASTVTSGQVLATSTWHASIVEYDVKNGIGYIFTNNTLTNIFCTAVGAVGAFPATDSFLITLGANGTTMQMADAFMFKGARMTDYQRAQWFAAVKARFALTTY